MAETGDILKEVAYGILKPLQKLNKAKDQPSNLRPIYNVHPTPHFRWGVEPPNQFSKKGATQDINF